MLCLLPHPPAFALAAASDGLLPALCVCSQDPGGDVRLGTGLPHVVDRVTKKRIIEVIEIDTQTAQSSWQ